MAMSEQLNNFYMKQESLATNLTVTHHYFYSFNSFFFFFFFSLLNNGDGPFYPYMHN